ncbi:MAG: L-threonylcarbamoyladenylate synthase [Candidatus Staskawiczbacteria bacterium]|nr:L-threonylcarbamoyladenylate synthase [Candidatus Staskawiczbacteria bacterium]
MKIIKLQNKSIDDAVEFLNRGGVVIFPTDTVYGFLADASNKKAVAKIYKIKKRPKLKPLAVFVKDLKMAKTLAEINKKQEKIVKNKWPGKFTFVFKGGKSTIALRIPKHKFLNILLKKVNKPLAQTSVNTSGQPPLLKISDIIKQFSKFDVLLMDGGNLKKSKPSKVLDLVDNKIIRK